MGRKISFNFSDTISFAVMEVEPIYWVAHQLVGISAGWLGHVAISESEDTKTLPTSRRVTQYV